MKNFYHTLIMWMPFVVIFSLAMTVLEAIEGNKIRTTEYLGFEFGSFLVFILATYTLILYPLSFWPLTFILTKFVPYLKWKLVIFAICGCIFGIIIFNQFYDERFVREYDLHVVSSMIIFTIASLLYALAEHAIKKNIRFTS